MQSSVSSSVAGKWNGQRLFKGAAPGTYWANHDAQTTGFTVAANQMPTATAAVSHIDNYSATSPYVSLTTSFDVAAGYATIGPAGIASPTSPGYVYVIDPTQGQCQFIDPVELISTSWLCHSHDGSQELVLAVANPSAYRSVLTNSPRRLGNGSGFPPAVSENMRALVFAIRDGEVLATSLPRNCVVRRVPIP